MKIELPNHPLRLAELIPILTAIPDAFDPGTVSCRAGCAACCRQLVPVSPPEAFYLASLVTPEVEAKFDEARERLDSSPLGRALNAPTISEARALEIALAYPRLRIDCPFLVEERCSIYDGRPMTCREYYVTTPKENCVMPSPGRPIKRVAVPIQLSEALSRVAAEMLGGEPQTIPLPRALAWAREHAAEDARTFAPDILTRALISAMTAVGQ
jgi:Fe-S-cluster containining protein